MCELLFSCLCLHGCGFSFVGRARPACPVLLHAQQRCPHFTAWHKQGPTISSSRATLRCMRHFLAVVRVTLNVSCVLQWLTAVLVNLLRELVVASGMEFHFSVVMLSGLVVDETISARGQLRLFLYLFELFSNAVAIEVPMLFSTFAVNAVLV